MTAVKKSICLLLCLVLLTGVTVVGASAVRLSDEDAIQYKLPVGVLAGMGIISGREDGRFDPTADLNRAEAAKLVCYALIGREAADGLKAAEAPFPDVPANAWYAPYVSYLKSVKVIDGYDDGRFYPNNPVTGLQLAKMLLVAAGYGQNGEYNGVGFTTQTYADALSKGAKYIFSGTKATDIREAATREEAALYLYNAMCYIERVMYKPVDAVYAAGYIGLGNTMASAFYGYVPDDTTVNVNTVAGSLTATTVKGYVVGNKITDSAGLAKNPRVTDKTRDDYYDRSKLIDDLTAADVAAGGTEKIYRADTGMELLGHYVKLHMGDAKKVYYVEDLASASAADVTINTSAISSDYTWKKDNIRALGFEYDSNVPTGTAVNYIKINGSLIVIGAKEDGAKKLIDFASGDVLSLIANAEGGKIDTVVKLMSAQP